MFNTKMVHVFSVFIGIITVYTFLLIAKIIEIFFTDNNAMDIIIMLLIGTAFVFIFWGIGMIVISLSNYLYETYLKERFSLV
jgi:hypothetical protein